MAQKQGINTPLVITLTLISASFLVVTIFAVQAWYNYEVWSEREAMWAEIGDRTAANARDRQSKSIRELRWVDKDKGVVAIPIEHAMQMIADNGGKATPKPN